MFNNLVSLVKSYGPSMAGWVLLMTFFAYIAGKGGKMAMKNLQALLDENEALRGRMKLSLDDCEAQIRRRNEEIRELNAVIETAHQTMRQMSREMLQLELKAARLTDELSHAQRDLSRYRGESHG